MRWVMRELMWTYTHTQILSVVVLILLELTSLGHALRVVPRSLAWWIPCGQRYLVHAGPYLLLWLFVCELEGFKDKRRGACDASTISGVVSYNSPSEISFICIVWHRIVYTTETIQHTICTYPCRIPCRLRGADLPGMRWNRPWHLLGRVQMESEMNI